jgi:hypothetical protein
MASKRIGDLKMPKFGEFISAKLKPTWKSRTKAAQDTEGYERGLKGSGIGQDDSDWVGTWDAKADKAIYGPLPPKHGTHPKEKPGS